MKSSARDETCPQRDSADSTELYLLTTPSLGALADFLAGSATHSLFVPLLGLKSKIHFHCLTRETGLSSAEEQIAVLEWI